MNHGDRVLIVGTGAMAGLFAARLAKAGRSVMMLGDWEEGLQALRNHGIRLLEAGGGESVQAVSATSDPADALPAQWALVLVKSWQTARAAEQLTACLAPDGLVLTLQNGAGNRETLERALGAGRVAVGVTTSGARLLSPGRVQECGDGVISVKVDSRLDPMIEMLRGAGFVVESRPEVESLLWGKLVVNAAINPLTALLNVPNGRLLEIQPARELASRVTREAAAVARRLGIELPYRDPALAMEAVARQTSSNRSSMLQDLERGRPTEIDAICGTVVRAGRQTGVATPLNQSLWDLVRSRVESYHPMKTEARRSEASGGDCR